MSAVLRMIVYMSKCYAAGLGHQPGREPDLGPVVPGRGVSVRTPVKELVCDE